MAAKLRPFFPSGQIARRLISRADRARDAKQYPVAAALYEEALRIGPDSVAIHIQCGHMFKESGDLANAEVHYLIASRLAPNDADLALQLGHFYKVAGRLDEAESAYLRAVELSPRWAEPVAEVSELRRRTGSDAGELAHSYDMSLDTYDRLVPELFPRQSHERRQIFVNPIQIRRLGTRLERSPWGVMPTLRGVEAVRGFFISSSSLVELRIALNRRTIHHTAALEAFSLGDPHNRRKFVFNEWLDFTTTAPGRHQIEISFIEQSGKTTVHRLAVVIKPALSETEFPDSDALVNLSAGDARPIDIQINSRPSVVRAARRSLFPLGVRKVLVMRTDQLGDMITSIPALRRLREILPHAEIVGLCTSSNRDLATTLGIFDEIIEVDFPDDPSERRRIMTRQHQIDLSKKLATYQFDVAIDLADSHVSRLLLLLSGAKFLYGFHHRDWPWLSGGFDGTTRDPRNDLGMAPQSTRVLALIENLGATLNSKAEVITRPELSRQLLERYGLLSDERYVVLHDGARIEFSRWPHYPELASLILRDTDLKVVFITNEHPKSESLLSLVADTVRFRLLDEWLPFDHFDALLSFCSVFVGNDSGPKHLAALRGTPVVSVHSARINWNEWGQEMSGVIISRKVPCAGCLIFHDSEDCGKGFSCIANISPSEVFNALIALMNHT